MGRYPAFLAQRMDQRGVPCVVDAIEDESARFRRVHLSGPGLREHEWQPCQVTKVRVSTTHFRHYTPDSYDPAAGRMSVLFYRHGVAAGNGSTSVNGPSVNGPSANGHEPTPAAVWLDALAPGDPVRPVLPDASRAFAAVGRVGANYLLCGDGTTVGLWHSFIRWLPAGARVAGAVELPAADQALGRELLPQLDVLPETGQPGAALLGWLQARSEAESQADHVYLSGHSQTIQRLRALLRERAVPRAAIRTQPYWATGRAGL